MKSKPLVIASTFSGEACDATKVLNLATQSETDFATLGYKTSVCFTVNGEREPTEEVVKVFLPSFPGEKKLIVNETREGRGPCFIAGIRNALEIIGDDDGTIITADLCGKAPHDPTLFLQFLELLNGNPDRVVVGSTLYDSNTIDDGEMRTMGYLQWAEYGADGDYFHIQSPALMIGSAVLFEKALRYYDIYVANFPKYSGGLPMPGPGVPGIMLCMLNMAGAKLHGVTLPVFGEWRPSRTLKELHPHMMGTVLPIVNSKQMQKDGLFD